MNPLLQDLIALAGPTVHAREIELGGQTRKLHFRELTAEQAETLFDIRNEDGSLDRVRSKGLRDRMLAASLCDADGKPALTAAEAAALPNRVAKVLHEAALQVNGLSKADAGDEGEGPKG